MNYYLTKGITKESEMADTEGSTATGALLLKNQKCTMCVSVCAHTQRDQRQKRDRREW